MMTIEEINSDRDKLLENISNNVDTELKENWSEINQRKHYGY